MSDGARKGPLADDLAKVKDKKKVVAALTKRLRDRKSRVAAAYVLAEIGGTQAAEALWHVYLDLLEDVELFHVFREVADNVWKAGGTRAYRVDHAFYSEVHMGLCYIGRPVAPAMVKRAEVALAKVQELVKGGHDLMPVRELVEGTRRVDEVGTVRPLMVLKELIDALGWIGDPAAAELIATALNSGIKEVRFTTLRAVRHLNSKEASVLRALSALLNSNDEYQDGVLVKEQAAALLLTLLGGKAIELPNLRRSERVMVIDVARERVTEALEHPER